MRQRKRIHKNAKIKKKTLHWQNGRQLCNEFMDLVQRSRTEYKAKTSFIAG